MVATAHQVNKHSPPSRVSVPRIGRQGFCRPDRCKTYYPNLHGMELWWYVKVWRLFNLCNGDSDVNDLHIRLFGPDQAFFADIFYLMLRVGEE